MSDAMKIVMQPEAQSGERLPDGGYYAVYRGNEIAPAREYQGKMLEPGIRWGFEVSRGPHKGRKLGPVTGAIPRPNNGCGRTLVGILGRTPPPGEDVDLHPCVGREYIVTVAGGRVASVTPPPQQ